MLPVFFYLLNSFIKPFLAMKSRARFFIAFSLSKLQEMFFITKSCAFKVSITELSNNPFISGVSAEIYCKLSMLIKEISAAFL